MFANLKVGVACYEINGVPVKAYLYPLWMLFISTFRQSEVDGSNNATKRIVAKDWRKKLTLVMGHFSIFPDFSL
jgi:1-acyl-sn-glycerol-3-phosphate acyltransferase